MQASESNEDLKSDVDYIFAASQYNTYTQGAGETKKSVIISLSEYAWLHYTWRRYESF